MTLGSYWSSIPPVFFNLAFMEAIDFNVNTRAKDVTAKSLRVEDKVPGVLYGQKKENLLLEFDYGQFEVLFREAGETTIIDLKIGDKSEKALIYDVQKDPVTDKIIHVDFYRINLKEEVAAMIPLEFVGVSPAVKEEGGILVTNRDELEVKSLPMDLPQKIEVDISVLAEIGDTIHIGDLKVSEGVSITDDPEISVAQVVAPKMEVGEPEEGEELVEGEEGEELVEDEKDEKSTEGDKKDGGGDEKKDEGEKKND